MKQVNNKFHGTKQKWFLTASLFTLLAGNYAFQISSKNVGAVEMSSTKPVAAKPVAAQPISNEMETQNEAYLKSKADDKAKEEATRKREDDRDKEMARLLGQQKTETAKTQAASVEEGACTSGDCKTTAVPSVSLSIKAYNNLIDRIAELEKQKTTVKPEEEKKEDAKPETRAEKRERLAQEKKNKEKEKQEERVAKFEDKMEDIKDKCDKDLECLASEFTSALTRFDGKNSIPPAIANKHFKSLISGPGGPLARSLYNDSADMQTTMQALVALMSEVPTQYSGIKQITMETVKFQTQIPATHIKEGYKTATNLSKQNNPQAYFDQLNQTQQDQKMLATFSNAYNVALAQGLRETGDQSSLSYYQRSYLPNMEKIMSSLISPTGVAQAGQQQQQEVTTTSRNSRTGQTTIQNPQQNSNYQKMTNPSSRGGATQQQIQWNVPAQNSGFQQGQPTTNSRGGRGRY